MYHAGGRCWQRGRLCTCRDWECLWNLCAFPLIFLGTWNCCKKKSLKVKYLNLFSTVIYSIFTTYVYIPQCIFVCKCIDHTERDMWMNSFCICPGVCHWIHSMKLKLFEIKYNTILLGNTVTYLIALRDSMTLKLSSLNTSYLHLNIYPLGSPWMDTEKKTKSAHTLSITSPRPWILSWYVVSECRAHANPLRELSLTWFSCLACINAAKVFDSHISPLSEPGQNTLGVTFCFTNKIQGQ